MAKRNERNFLRKFKRSSHVSRKRGLRDGSFIPVPSVPIKSGLDVRDPENLSRPSLVVKRRFCKPLTGVRFPGAAHYLDGKIFWGKPLMTAQFCLKAQQ